MTLSPLRIIGITVPVLLIALLGAGGWYHAKIVSALSSELASTTAAYHTTQDALKDSQDHATALSYTLAQEQQKNGTFEGQISELSSTVTTLDKLAKTDPELLDKYSKVYFLNDNYVPSSLSDIDTKYLYQKDRTLQFHAEALPHLTQMMDAAEDDGVHLLLISAYRSFGTQAALKSSYTVTYGAGANKFSADQGYSEHQLGTAVDFTTKALGADFSNGFEKSDGYAWLIKNAWRYGFILSYPPKNTYYEYEPWHWRYVGIKLATDLHDQGKWFYDLDQRTLDTYLPSLFDTE